MTLLSFLFGYKTFSLIGWSLLLLRILDCLILALLLGHVVKEVANGEGLHDFCRIERDRVVEECEIDRVEVLNDSEVQVNKQPKQ